MENKNTISVILPIKSARAVDFDEFFGKCITSIKNQDGLVDEVVIVHTGEDRLKEFLSSFDFGELNVVLKEYTGEPSFAGQVNYGVNEATSEWVSVLEFDDEYSNVWFKNVKSYMTYYPEIDAFMPIVVDVDDKGVFVGFTNEATFAANFTNEMGRLDHDTLLTYQNFQFSGLVMRKSSYTKYGMVKESFKLTFGYEFFLRMTSNDVKFLTIPKIGYKHMNLREGSIFWNYKNGEDKMVEDEVRFWIDLAKKEYLFIKDREIKYEPQEV
jgi:glycosyltransferase involved in cell wall biosynthesis